MHIDKETKRPKLVANVNSKAIKSVINIKPQLPDVTNENGPVVAKSPLAEKILALSARRKRDNEMREEQSEIRTLKPIIEQAPAEKMKLRAESMARNILRQKFSDNDYFSMNESNRTRVDMIVESKQDLIQSVAKRLMPKIRESELQRMNKPLIEQTMFEDLVDAVLTENLDQKIEKLIRIGLGDKNQLNKVRMALSDTKAAANTVVLRKYIVDTLDKLMKLVTDDAVIYQRIVATLMKKRNLKESAVSVALRRKSEKSGYDFNTLAEVYVRGMGAWNENSNANPVQYAFNRVNSFVSGGKAMYLDEDLVVDTNPKISKKKDKSGIYAINRRSPDPLAEKFETSEMQSKDSSVASSRFDGTSSIDKIYKNDTPGQRGLAKKINKIVTGAK